MYLHSFVRALPSLKDEKANWAWKKQTNQDPRVVSSGVCALGKGTQGVGNKQVGA